MPNERLHNFHSAPNNVKAVKSSMIRWAGQETRMVDMRNTLV
jgi:hypothetical protein